MEVLYLREADVERLLTMDSALEALEATFRAHAAGRAQNHPRRRLHPRGGATLHYLAALDETAGYFGLKLYTTSHAGARFLVPLFRADTGALAALIEADYLGCVRTGAATGLATKYMARPEATRVGLLGAGHQAPTQLEALATVRRLERVRVFSPTAERRAAFARRMSERLSLPVDAVETAEAAVREADIVVTITSAREPVLRGEWLAPGCHVNAAGVNSARKRELDEAAVARAARIVVDSREQAREEAGDLIVPFQAQPDRWQQTVELCDVVAGKVAGRGDGEEITLFKSLGVALEDVAVAARVVERARREKVGERIRMWE